jgi:hypothetical protein
VGAHGSIRGKSYSFSSGSNTPVEEVTVARLGNESMKFGGSAVGEERGRWVDGLGERKGWLMERWEPFRGRWGPWMIYIALGSHGHTCQSKWVS